MLCIVFLPKGIVGLIEGFKERRSTETTGKKQ
jgi:hypothetical protein